MLSTTSVREGHERLLLDRDRFPIQIEAGNPFMVPQEYDLLSHVSSLPDSIKDVKHLSVSDSGVRVFRSKVLELTSSRLERIPNNVHLITNLGIAHLNNEDFDVARDYFQKALEIDKQYFPAIANLAKIHLMKGEVDEALEIYFRLEKVESENIKVLNNIASLFIAKRNMEKAYDYLERAIRIDEKNVAALHNIATVLLLKRDFDKAILFYRRALSIKSDLSASLNNLGVCFAIKKSYKKAIRSFLAAWHTNRQAVAYICNLARAYQETGAHDKAIKVLENYLKTGYDDKEVIDILAWSYASMKDYRNCITYLKRSLTLSENIADKATILNNLGSIYHCMKDYKNAEKCYRLCLESQAVDWPIVFQNAIRLYFEQNKDQQAKKVLDQALAIFPDDPYILECLGRYYYETEDYRRASETLRQVIAKKPDIIDSYATLSVIEMEINNENQKAKEILTEGLSHNPTNLILLNNLAYNYLLCGETGKARQLLDKIKDQNDQFLTATRGLLLISEDNIKEGSRLYNLAMAIASKNRGVAILIEQKKYLELGKYFLRKGNKTEAKRLLKKALTLKPKYGYFRNQAQELLGAT